MYMDLLTQDGGKLFLVMTISIIIIIRNFLKKIVFHELCEYVPSNDVAEKMICHKTYTCDLCVLHELCGCASSNVVLVKMIYHKIHICNLCGLQEQCGCVSSNVVLEKMIYHKIHI